MSPKFVKLAVDKLKHFTMGGYQLRFLEFEVNLVKPHNLDKFSKGDLSIMSSAVKSIKVGMDDFDVHEMACKPDNSENKCNLCVTGLDNRISEKSLERIFSTKYGQIKSCKISKSEEGQLHNYGFIWFENAKDANKAKMDSCRNREIQTNYGPMSFKLDWYQLPSIRQIKKEEQLMAKDHAGRPLPHSREQNKVPYQKIIVRWARFEF